MKKQVQILLSTYNGENYIEEQLESLLAQDYQEISILIRDDGSSDQTIEIIKKYSMQYDNIEYYSGENIGVINSFLDLIKHRSKDTKYFAFCDQDDIWLPNKISKAVAIMENNQGKMQLYCGNPILVDYNRERLKKQLNGKKKPSFGNALIENICIGCTAIVTSDLLEYMKDIDTSQIVMHDWWLYLVASCFGIVHFDEQAGIEYRQHNSNVIGSSGNFLKKMLRRVQKFQMDNIIKQNLYFGEKYNKNMSIEQKELIKEIVTYKKNLKTRLKIIMNRNIKRQNRIDDFIFKMIFLLL